MQISSVSKVHNKLDLGLVGVRCRGSAGTPLGQRARGRREVGARVRFQHGRQRQDRHGAQRARHAHGRVSSGMVRRNVLPANVRHVTCVVHVFEQPPHVFCCYFMMISSRRR